MWQLTSIRMLVFSFNVYTLIIYYNYFISVNTSQTNKNSAGAMATMLKKHNSIDKSLMDFKISKKKVDPTRTVKNTGK